MSAFREPEIIAIQIRPDWVVRIHGIPFDLTPEEAERIAAVVKAYAVPRALNRSGDDG